MLPSIFIDFLFFSLRSDFSFYDILQGVGLQIGVGVDNPEIQARLNAVEQENKDLKSSKRYQNILVMEINNM